MSENMAFAEGCYRLAGEDWHIVTARKAEECQSVEIRRGVKWSSGVSGLNILFPLGVELNAPTILKIMSEALGVTEWNEVRGPDSMALR